MSQGREKKLFSKFFMIIKRIGTWTASQSLLRETLRRAKEDSSGTSGELRFGLVTDEERVASQTFNILCAP